MKKQILCLSTSSYHPIPTRKQNLMNRLTDCDIIYADPPVSFAAPLKDASTREKLLAYKNPPEEIRSGLSVYASPPVLPLANRKRRINIINQKRLAAYYAGLCRRHGFGEDMTVWCYSPQSADLIEPLARMLGIAPEKLRKQTVYDCVDRHSAYPGLIDPATVDKMEEDLARSCGVCIATAEGLYERLKAFNPNTHLVPNGVDYELFSRACGLRRKRLEGGEGGGENAERRPVFGFVGVIQECTDQNCLISAAKAFPEGRVRIIGKRLPGVDMSGLEELDNVELVPPVPQDELPGLMADFDVCLNCFDDSELSKDVSPLKFYEYLATGIPVLSTPQPLQVRDYADCIYISEGAADFSEKLREALNEGPDDPRAAERMGRARQCGWDEKVKEIRRIVAF